MALTPSSDSRKATSSRLSINRKIDLGRLVQAVCDAICSRLATGGVTTPTAGIEPFSAVSSSVDVKGDEDYRLAAGFHAYLVDTTAALWEGDILQFRYQKPGMTECQRLG